MYVNCIHTYDETDGRVRVEGVLNETPEEVNGPERGWERRRSLSKVRMYLSLSVPFLLCLRTSICEVVVMYVHTL